MSAEVIVFRTNVAMPLCSELMSRPKKAVAGSRPERTTPGGSSRAGRGRQYCKLRWLLSRSRIPPPQMYFRAQNAEEARYLATVYLHKFML